MKKNELDGIDIGMQSYYSGCHHGDGMLIKGTFVDGDHLALDGVLCLICCFGEPCAVLNDINSLVAN
jgi:hypothetical protein